ncbi:MAG: family hydrolase [Gammaproteobacteria bacterium]|jgi:phosphoglycolate phosphatase|nr:family hydrolase [Gammaproteobacteria bacterium]
MKKPCYDLLVFDWNGTLSTARMPQAHYGESASVPPLFPGVKSVLKQLRDQGYMLAVLSAASKRKLQFETAHHEIDRYFALLQGGDQAYAKPDPQALLEIIFKLGMEPKRTLMIGDSESDMQMALEANVDRLAACYGLGEQDSLMQYQPLGCISSINDILEWLNTESCSLKTEPKS